MGSRGAPAYRLLTAARARAKARGLPFNLVLEDIVIPETCPVLGIPLRRNLAGHTHTANSPSLDRLVPDLGYVKGNVHVISARANMLKSNASPDEMRRILEWYEQAIRSSLMR